jgi:predicted ester cyclase
VSAENEALTRRWFEEVWNKQRPEAIDEMMAPEGIAYGLGGANLVGPEAFKGFHNTFLGAFPDIRITVDDIISQGDKVAVRFSVRGTHRGDHLGVVATNRPVEFSAMSFVRWRSGQIVEGWNSVDMHGMLQQIDAVQTKAKLG